MTTIKWWHPDLYLKNHPKRLARQAVFRTIRTWFEGQDFFEVDTPALQISPGLEVHLRAFQTQFDDPLGGAQTFYLHTSPEFTMKKLVTAGLPRIFQLCKTYRNEGVSATHQPEFTMLEWYRAGADYNQIMQDTIDLVRACARACSAQVLRHGDRTCDPFRPWQKLTVQPKKSGNNVPIPIGGKTFSFASCSIGSRINWATTCRRYCASIRHAWGLWPGPNRIIPRWWNGLKPMFAGSSYVMPFPS